MKYVILIAVVVLLLIPITRCALFNIVSVVINAFKDIFLYFKQKKYNYYSKTGQLVAYTGLFGKGKTLSAVATVVGIYLKYDGKTVWSKSQKKFVTQKIKILSNVSLCVPYEDLTGLQQVVDDCKNKLKYDEALGTQTITLVLIDEASVLFCNRDFKGNINNVFLNNLLTCRHYMLSMFYTTQRFKMVDMLLRRVTQAVIDCDKIWRFQRQYIYDAFDLENASDITKVKPHRSICWFVRNKHYEMYDTLACVDNLVKACEEGKLMSDEEILNLIGENQSNDDAVRNASRSLRKQRKRG